MVIHKNHRSFYIRHSESSVPMSAHEIRDSVLASATAEGKALRYCAEMEIDARENLVQDQTAFLMQAMPLIPLAERWETTDDEFAKALRGYDRTNRYQFNVYTLQSSIVPTPTIRGIRGAPSRSDPEWLTEAHHNGYVQAICYAEYHDGRLLLHEGYFDLFAAFLDLVEACVAAGPGDSPYVLRLALLNSKGAIFQASRDRYAQVESLRERELQWPDWIRQVGDPFMDACEDWCNLLYNAFGLAWRITEHPVRERALRGDL